MKGLEVVIIIIILGIGCVAVGILGFGGYQLRMVSHSELNGGAASCCSYLGGTVCSEGGVLYVIDLVLDLVDKAASPPDFFWGEAIAGRVSLDGGDGIMEVVKVGQVVEDGIQVLASAGKLGRRFGIRGSVSDARVRREERPGVTELAQDISTRCQMRARGDGAEEGREGDEGNEGVRYSFTTLNGSSIVRAAC